MEITTTFTAVRSLSPDEVRAWIRQKNVGDFTLLDVRQPPEHRLGHIAGSLLIPLSELPARFAELDPSRPVVAYCRSGNRSRSAASFLAEAGMTAFNMEGGMLAWNGSVAKGPAEAGMDLVKGRTTVEQLAALAWALEEGAAVFYRRLMEHMEDEGMRGLFRALVAAEEGHMQKVVDAYRRTLPEDLRGRVSGERLGSLMEGGFSSDSILEDLRARGSAARDALETAMQIEVNSLDLYVRIIRWSGMPEVKEIFSTLVEEEKSHLARLGALLEAAVA